MEVTSANFEAMLPLVADALTRCEFFAFDCEFTGLHVEDGQMAYLDEIQDRYDQMVSSSQSFLINQFGLSAFCWDAKAHAYQAHTFNFYVFPRPFEAYDRRFMCQASSLAFLASQGFDFNKFISQGIAFMPLQYRDARLAQVEQQAQPAQEQQGDIPIKSAADQLFVEALIADVTSWLQGDAPSLDLPSVNGYLRKVQYQQLAKDQFGAEHAPGFFIQRCSSEEGRAFLQLVRATAEQVQQQAEELRAARCDAIRAAAGFSTVWELIRDSGKPGVGHNLSLDLSYSLQSFIQELPPMWPEYKALVQAWLPGGLFDTKYLAECLDWGDLRPSSGLGDLYTALQLDAAGAAAQGVLQWRPQHAVSPTAAVADAVQQYHPPVIRHAPGFERYVEGTVQQYAHEAGYDAYMTGAVFAHLCTLYAAAQRMMPPAAAAAAAAAAAGTAGDGGAAAAEAAAGSLAGGSSVAAVAKGDGDGASQRMAVVADKMGRLRIPRSDFPFLSLYGPDVIPDRSHVLVLPCGTGLQRSDVSDRAMRAGLGWVRISAPRGWRAHVFLEVMEADKVAGAALALQGGTDLQVCTYAEWRLQQQAVAPSPELGTSSAPKRRRVAG